MEILFCLLRLNQNLNQQDVDYQISEGTFWKWYVNITSYLPLKELNVAVGLWFMVFNATFNNISVILRQSVLLVEETNVPGSNHRPVTSN